MKIAVVTEDEVTISQHFGRAPLYVVFTVERNAIVGKETRAKASHQHGGPTHGQPPGFDTAAETTHATMTGSITDCQAVIAGGMGWGAFQSLKGLHIEPVLTDVENIEEAVKLYLQGKLPSHTEWLH